MGVVEKERDGAIATIRLNRPDRMNTMSEELLGDLLEALEELSSDPSVAVVILTGNGRAFCAGGDLTTMFSEQDEIPAATQVTSLRRHMRAVELLRGMPAVTIAMVNGACAGAGMGLATACDLRFAADEAVFRVAFLGAAVSGDFGVAWLLTRLLGEARTREFYLLDEKVRAEEALRVGLVSAVHPALELEERVRRAAARIAASAPMARRAIKLNLNEAATTSFTDALAAEAERHIACALSEDAAEAGKAFLDRRAPVFIGR